jgi:hypothetical protein
MIMRFNFSRWGFAAVDVTAVGDFVVLVSALVTYSRLLFVFVDGLLSCGLFRSCLCIFYQRTSSC